VRKTLIASFLFFALFCYGLILSQANISVLGEKLEPANTQGYFDYRGVTNVHTTRGYGSGTATDIVNAAQEAGLDFIFITDLNVFGPNPTPDGYHRQLLLLNAAEYSYLDSRLFLYDIAKQHQVESLGQTQGLLADLLSQSGPDAEQDLIVLAHPFKLGYSWSGPYPTGLDGIEVINLKSIWQKAWTNSKISFLWSVFIYPFNPRLAFLRLYEEPQEEIDLWDQLQAKQKTIGLVGADATSKAGPVGNLYVRFPAYETSFSLVSNHILLRSELTGEAEGDRRKILRALTDGQFYMSIDVLGNPKGFVTYIQDRDRIVPLGSRTKWSPGMKIMVHLPSKPRTPYEVAFFKDGEHIMSSNSVDTAFEVHGPGVYRMKVRIFTNLTLADGYRWVPWIYTNPFYVDAK
jgi:hypothetical protein